MKLLPLFIVAAVVSVVLALPAFGGKPNGPTLDFRVDTTTTLSATTVTSLTLYGCGYNKLTTLELWHGDNAPYTEVVPDADGCVSATFPSAGSGDYVGQAMIKQGQSWRLVVEVPFTV